MDPKLKAIIEMMNAHRKTNHPWKRGEAVPQPYWTWSSQMNKWIAVHVERMTVALDFLKQYTASIPNPCVIMLNEMLESDLSLIGAQRWVSENYNLTDLSHEFWESGYYGTCVLIPWALPISNLFRVHYEDTAMERDGLFLDLAVRDKTVRICSTHLESLIAKPPKRPSQLATAAKFMHQADASILGGDLNAIEPFDRKLHSDNNLKDAYLERGGIEDAESGMTWGQMAATKERNKFGLSRMDKLMFCGAINITHLETFGMDVMIEEESIVKEMMAEEGLERPWVTDHLGIRGDFTLL